MKPSSCQHAFRKKNLPYFLRVAEMACTAVKPLRSAAALSGLSACKTTIPWAASGCTRLHSFTLFTATSCSENVIHFTPRRDSDTANARCSLPSEASSDTGTHTGGCWYCFRPYKTLSQLHMANHRPCKAAVLAEATATGQRRPGQAAIRLRRRRMGGVIGNGNASTLQLDGVMLGGCYWAGPGTGSLNVLPSSSDDSLR